MARGYIVCELGGEVKPKVDLINLDMSNFSLTCECGTVTTYGSMFKTQWKEGMGFSCRECKKKYYPTIYVAIKAILDEINSVEDEK